MRFFTDWFYNLSSGDVFGLFVLIGFMVYMRLRYSKNFFSSLFKKPRKKKKKRANATQGGTTEPPNTESAATSDGESDRIGLPM